MRPTKESASTKRSGAMQNGPSLQPEMPPLGNASGRGAAAAGSQKGRHGTGVGSPQQSSGKAVANIPGHANDCILRATLVQTDHRSFEALARHAWHLGTIKLTADEILQLPCRVTALLLKTRQRDRSFQVGQDRFNQSSEHRPSVCIVATPTASV